jgi:hypothetical protein
LTQNVSCPPITMSQATVNETIMNKPSSDARSAKSAKPAHPTRSFFFPPSQSHSPIGFSAFTCRASTNPSLARERLSSAIIPRLRAIFLHREKSNFPHPIPFRLRRAEHLHVWVGGGERERGNVEAFFTYERRKVFPSEHPRPP